MSDGDFLRWIEARLINYGDNKNVDFLHRLRTIADYVEQLSGEGFYYKDRDKFSADGCIIVE